ncbi:sensor histidine kinase [Thalassovita taeanensis]|uniref:histidine kinase n=1 Tax=Thalassovita taeanensis TaxID=657014 RepID=A0A1H9AH51_9RHOB|nr:ATP-binding protein [Thalassovita taeanensis]SEP75811.1 hypothetical protein SAMN04488092_102131 [Thalassovita taeanensis]
MRLRGSASLRVTLLVASGIILLSLGAMALQYRVTARSLDARQAEILSADLEAFAAFYEQRRIVALRQAIAFRAQSHDVQALYLLQDRHGSVLAGNLTTWPPGVTPTDAGFSPEGAQHFRLSGVDYIGVARALPGGFPFLVARARTATQATLADLRRLIGWVTLGLIAASLLAGGWVARAVLGRIGRINALADRVAAGDLTARLPGPRSADEFGTLEAHVHNMLDRIEALNRATSRLSDTIAHELRTPLNRIQQKLSRIKGQEQAVSDIQAEMRATIRIFDALLDISSAEAAKGQRPGLVPVNLSVLAGEVFELYAPLAEDRGLSCTAQIAPDLMVLGERSLLAQMVSNLLDNAIKFCRPGDAIHLSLCQDAGGHVLRVADTGPGLPEDLRASLFERFTRAPRDQAVAGHGLGLALVQAIATRHGAKLSLPGTDKGFAIKITCPKLDQTE